MKHELDKMMDLIKDYKTGYGGVTDSFIRKELEMFAKDYHALQLQQTGVSGGFSKKDRVHKNGKVGTVTRVSDKAVHVRYDDDFFEKFHFQPTHHMQTSITALKHFP